MTPDSATVGIGTTARFAVEYVDDRGIASPATGAQWSISDPTLANLAVREDGGAVATGVRVGNATLTVNYRGLSATVALTVRTGVALARLEITPASPSVAAGLTRQLTATGIYSDNTVVPFTNLADWSSSDPQVLTVDNLTKKGLVTGVAPGTATVIVTAGSVTAQITFTVTDAQLVSLAVTPTNPSVAAGTTQQFTATGTFTDNSTQDITTQVTWSSGNSSIATVSNTSGSQGLATGVAGGSTAITATLGSVSGSTTLTVTVARLMSIAVTPTNPSLPRGTNRQFTATGTFSNNTTQNITAQVTWTSSDTNIATVSDAAGSKGLASAVNIGAATLTATMGSVNGSTTVDVTAAQLVAISVTPTNPSLARGTNRQLTATGIYTDSTTQDLTTQVAWTSSDETLASVSNATGSQGLASALNMGSVTISASQGTVTGTTTLAVTPAEVVSIAITPTNPSLPRGTTRQLIAMGTFTDATTQDLTTQVTWSSSDTNVATVSGAAGSEGLATAVNLGPATITATMGSVSGTTDLTVTAAELVSITITPTNPMVPIGTDRQLTATGIYTDATTQNLTDQVTWSSSDETIATVSNADGSRGLVTSVAQGPTTITAIQGTISGTTSLTVTSAVLRSIAIAPASPSLARGTTQQLTATGTFTDNTTQNLTTQVTWTSSSTNIATVSTAPGSEGLATAVNLGTATITATMDGVSGTTDLTVTAARLVSINITPTNPSLAEGVTRQLTATGIYTDATTQNLTTQVTWSSSDDTIATVSNTPGTQGLATAIVTGSVIITATMGTISGTTNLTVSDAVLTSIEIAPANPSLPLGRSGQFVAVGVYSDTSLQDLTDLVTWASSDDTIATVSNAAGSHGLATSVSPGVVTVTATLGTLSTTTTLTITPAQLVSIAIAPATPSLPRGTTQQLTATGTYTDNTTLDITTQVTWLSSDDNIATVSNVDGTRGLATAANVGNVTITATLDGVNGTIPLAVTPALLVSIAIMPNAPSLPRGTTQQLTAMGTYTDATIQDITDQVAWISSDANIAAVSSAMGSRGLVTAVNVGSANISATMGTVSNSISVTVTPARLASIAITPANPAILVGATQQFVATGTYTDASTQTITASVTWSSSDTAVATISNATGSHGLATSVAGGVTTITATLGTVSSTATLTVRAPVSLAVTPASANVARNMAVAFTATITYNDNTTQDVTATATWASSNAAIATVGTTSTSRGHVTGVAAGTATITATSGSLTAQATATVVNCYVTVNEVQVAGATTGTGAVEFVELYNGCGFAIDLNGARLFYRSATGTADTTLWSFDTSTMIGAGGFLVYGGQTFTGPNDGLWTLNGTNGQLSGTAGGVGLVFPSTYTGGASNLTTDSVAYGATAANIYREGSTPAPVPVGGSSIRRRPDGTDTNSSSADFTTTTTPTPRATNG